MSTCAIDSAISRLNWAYYCLFLYYRHKFDWGVAIAVKGYYCTLGSGTWGFASSCISRQYIQPNQIPFKPLLLAVAAGQYTKQHAPVQWKPDSTDPKLTLLVKDACLVWSTYCIQAAHQPFFVAALASLGQELASCGANTGTTLSATAQLAQVSISYSLK